MSDLDDALTQLLEGQARPVFDEDGTLASVVVRARRRVRRRRAALVASAALVVALIGAAVVISRGDDSRIRVETTQRHLSASDVSFAIFRRPATSADTLPLLLRSEHFLLDPNIGSRLAIRTAREQVFVWAALPCTPSRSLPEAGACLPGQPPRGEQYCAGVVQGGSASASCAPADSIAKLGSEAGSMIAGAGPPVRFGIVPDFVSGISSAGDDVPISNNAFVLESPTFDEPLTIATPDGDKDPLPYP